MPQQKVNLSGFKEYLRPGESETACMSAFSRVIYISVEVRCE